MKKEFLSIKKIKKKNILKILFKISSIYNIINLKTNILYALYYLVDS